MRSVCRLQSAREQCHLELKSGSPAVSLRAIPCTSPRGTRGWGRHRVPSRGRSFARSFAGLSRGVRRVVGVLLLLKAELGSKILRNFARFPLAVREGSVHSPTKVQPSRLPSPRCCVPCDDRSYNTTTKTASTLRPEQRSRKTAFPAVETTRRRPSAAKV